MSGSRRRARHGAEVERVTSAYTDPDTFSLPLRRLTLPQVAVLAVACDAYELGQLVAAERRGLRRDAVLRLLEDVRRELHVSSTVGRTTRCPVCGFLPSSA